jgi:hypothetical protein
VAGGWWLVAGGLVDINNILLESLTACRKDQRYVVFTPSASLGGR